MLQSKIFNVRNEQHLQFFYPVLEKWWKDWGFTPIAPPMLSENGIMIFNNGTPICAAWLYSTDSNNAVVNWAISSRDHKDKRKGCIEELINQLEVLAKNLGFELLSFPASNPYLSNKLEKLGFGHYADHNMTNYCKSLWEKQYQE